MTYATVIVNLDAFPRMNERTDYAVRLALRFESHLVGVAAADHSLFGMGVATGFSGADGLAGAIEASHAAALRRAQSFRDRVSALKYNAFETVIDEQDDVAAMVSRSGCSDLVILAQTNHAWKHGAQGRGQLEQIVLESVAPTLVLPHSCDLGSVGNRVLIAWDGSPGAARAVAGAIPMLRRAERVELVRFDTPEEVQRHTDVSALDLPREWLARHGVRIDIRHQATEVDVANALLSHAFDCGADMLVMGAWGHPRWAERLVGGVTQTILTSMTLPVLMSH